jgi:hypothetical protein
LKKKGFQYWDLAKETTNTKRHNNHFLNAKTTEANSKLPFNSRLKEFPLVSCGFFNNMSVNETSFFVKKVYVV